MVQLCKDALMPQNLKVHSRPPPQSPRDAARQAKVCAILPRADARHFTAISPLYCFTDVSPCATPLVSAAAATAAPPALGRTITLELSNFEKKKGKKAGGKCRSLFPFSVMMTIDGLTFRSIVRWLYSVDRQWRFELDTYPGDRYNDFLSWYVLEYHIDATPW